MVKNPLRKMKTARRINVYAVPEFVPLRRVRTATNVPARKRASIPYKLGSGVGFTEVVLTSVSEPVTVNASVGSAAPWKVR